MSRPAGCALHVLQDSGQPLGELRGRRRQARCQVARADLGAHRQALKALLVVSNEVHHFVPQSPPLQGRPEVQSSGSGLGRYTGTLHACWENCCPELGGHVRCQPAGTQQRRQRRRKERCKPAPTRRAPHSHLFGVKGRNVATLCGLQAPILHFSAFPPGSGETCWRCVIEMVAMLLYEEQNPTQRKWLPVQSPNLCFRN